MSSVDTLFMRMIRTFCNNTNPGAGFGGTKRKASDVTGFGLTPVAKRSGNSLGSNLDTPEQTAKSNIAANPVTPAKPVTAAPIPPVPANAPALSAVLPNIPPVTESELQSPPGMMKNLKKGVSNFIAGFENDGV